MNLLKGYYQITRLKQGFTLAEILITLGIIGVVAVITVPTLISNVQNYVKSKRVENIEQKFSKATDKMLIASGLEDYNSTQSFVNELSKHLNIAQICDNNSLRSCWPTDTVTLNNGKEWDISKTTSGKTLKMVNDENNEWDNTMGIITADGTSFIMSYNKKCAMPQTTSPSWIGSKSSSTNCVAAIYDWNGSSKPNTFGMTTSGKNDIIPLNANGLGNACSIEVNGKCFGAFFKTTCIQLDECRELKSLGIIDSCAIGCDYFAGAAKQCGGMDNLPSISDLNALKDELKKGDWNTNTSNLGLPAQFSVWGSNGYDYYSFYLNGGIPITTMDRTKRYDTLGVCLID